MPTTADFTNRYHELYDNEFISTEIEDQYESKLNLNQFCTVDNTLEGGAGFIKKIMTYFATGDGQELEMGEGNDLGIEVGFKERAYTTKLVQTMFEYYDEQAMNDPNVVPVGIKHMSTSMFNRVNNEIYGEWMKGSQTVACTSFSFDKFVDAKAILDTTGSDATGEMSPDGGAIFAICHPLDVAAIRKALKDDLKYVEGYVRTGYVGHVAGIPLIEKRDATQGVIVMATKAAVTVFNKKGTEVERPPRARGEANVRLNTIFARRYYIVALTDDSQVVLMYTGTKPTTSGSDPAGVYDLTSSSATHTGKTPAKPASGGGSEKP